MAAKDECQDDGDDADKLNGNEFTLSISLPRQSFCCLVEESSTTRYETHTRETGEIIGTIV